MKIKKIIFYCFITIAFAAIVFTSCKKTHDYTLVNTTDDTSAQTIIASDESEINNEFDQAVNDALTATAISSTTSGDSAGVNLFEISGAVIDSSQSNTGIIKINYYNKTADNKKARLGEVKIQHAIANGKVIPWKTKGARATITFTNYEVFFLNISNKTLSLNGTSVIENISGGLLKNIKSAPGDSLIDKVSAQLAFTYNDNTSSIQSWTWNFNQRRVFSLQDTIVTASIQGDTAINNINNVSTWGMTRSGQNFYTGTTTPVLQNLSGVSVLTNPLKGRKIIFGIKEPITVTYGVDQQGTSVSTGNPYGYIITWLSGSQPKQAVVKYY